MKMVHKIDPMKRGTGTQPRTSCGNAPKQTHLVTEHWNATTCDACRINDPRMTDDQRKALRERVSSGL